VVLSDKDADVLRRLAAVSDGDINPMAAVFGGIVGQEIMKASSAKFTPINQFLYFDAVECLPKEFPLASTFRALPSTDDG
jgi:ubiquitin-activating enzyme E1